MESTRRAEAQVTADYCARKNPKSKPSVDFLEAVERLSRKVCGGNCAHAELGPDARLRTPRRQFQF